ncbi:MAG: thiamine-phosphate kinase [Bacteroidia bacterium]
MFQQPANKTELGELGEFGLIKQLTKDIEIKNVTSIVGVGDDAAVLNFEGKDVLITTDMLLEAVHFDLTYMPLKHLGYKAAVVNFSDIYAMNGKPEQITVGIAVSNRFPVEALEQLYEGISLACTNYGVDLVGGDTTSSKAGLIISITAIGTVDKGKSVLRTTAQKGDLLVVSGDLGGAYMGLQLLEREKSVFMEAPGTQPDLEGYDYILERQLKPEARRDIIDFLKEKEVTPTSMIDISDGLSSEIFHLCDGSGLGCKLYEEKIPIDPTTYNLAREFGIDPTVCALSGGEDYELLFTISQDDYEKIKGSMLITVVGHMSDSAEGKLLIDKNGGVHDLKAQGWKSF